MVWCGVVWCGGDEEGVGGGVGRGRGAVLSWGVRVRVRVRVRGDGQIFLGECDLQVRVFGVFGAVFAVCGSGSGVTFLLRSIRGSLQGSLRH